MENEKQSVLEKTKDRAFWIVIGLLIGGAVASAPIENPNGYEPTPTQPPIRTPVSREIHDYYATASAKGTPLRVPIHEDPTASPK